MLEEGTRLEDKTLNLSRESIMSAQVCEKGRVPATLRGALGTVSQASPGQNTQADPAVGTAGSDSSPVFSDVQ